MLEKYVCPSCEQSIEWDDSSCEEFIVCRNCGDKFKSPNAPMFIKGAEIGDYIIEKRLGIGGMGEVYLAEQKSMMRPVALKVLQPDLVEDSSYLERFYREVRTLAQIHHPNIVSAIETGYENKICYFSMSYVKGKDLKERLDTEGKMSEIDALYVILNVADALKYVWEKHKLIHRDIKPANIILTDEHEVKLMDLGISKIVTDDRSGDLTMAGMMVGSPYYISPEQARAEKDVDWRADMYSLGASFYHMLVGELPFDADNAMGIIAAHLSKPIPDPRKKVPEITDRSANIVGQMMQKNKADRFPSWDDAIESIQKAIYELSDIGAETTILTAVSPEKLKNVKKAPQKQNKASSDKVPSDLVEKIKKTVGDSIISNLYVRFVILVLLLFITFLAFFKVVERGMHEAKTKKVNIKIEKYNRSKPALITTRHGRMQLKAMLEGIKQAGLKKSSEWAENEQKKLHQATISAQQQRQNNDSERVLARLKERSYRMEEKGDLNSAIQLWQNYAKQGAFANELKDEIKTATEYLILKKRQKRKNIIE